MIHFAVEPWDGIKAEILPLWIEHYDEVADPEDRLRYPLDPDWAKYDTAANDGRLVILIARDRGVIIGYVFGFVDTHLHYKTLLCCFVDLYWINPDYRGQWLGVRMFRELENIMRGRGVRKVFGGTKLWLDARTIFRRCGWKEAELSHTKWIGN